MFPTCYICVVSVSRKKNWLGLASEILGFVDFFSMFYPEDVPAELVIRSLACRFGVAELLSCLRINTEGKRFVL